MTRILGIAGSLRRHSYNRALLGAAAEVAPGGVEVDVASIDDIPLYDGDVEKREGIPEPVARLKDRIAASDGLLLATPEYNNSIPGVLKNAIDWLSRPPDDIERVFSGKAAGVIGGGGLGGTRLSQAALLPVYRYLKLRPYFGGSVYAARVWQDFEDGTLVDEALRERLADWMEGFAAFVTGRG